MLCLQLIWSNCQNHATKPWPAPLFSHKWFFCTQQTNHPTKQTKSSIQMIKLISFHQQKHHKMIHEQCTQTHKCVCEQICTEWHTLVRGIIEEMMTEWMVRTMLVNILTLLGMEGVFCLPKATRSVVRAFRWVHGSLNILQQLAYSRCIFCKFSTKPWLEGISISTTRKHTSSFPHLPEPVPCV